MSVPNLCLHKASKRFFIWAGGKRVYFKGRGDNLAKPPAEVLAQYREALRHVLNDEPVKPDLVPETMTVAELASEFLRYAETEYRFSQQASTFKNILRPLVREYGLVPAAAFGPRKLIGLQEAMVRDGRTRQGVNKALTMIRQVFRWGVEREFVPPSVFHGLQTVRPLRKGRTDAPESRKLEAVPDDLIHATLPHLGPMVGDMVMVQRHTGMRPGEVCGLTMGELDRSGDVWKYRPANHKTAWRDSIREIDIGPKAQAILEKYFRADGLPLFSPQDAMAERRETRRRLRQSKVQPSQLDRRKDNPEIRPGHQYTRLAYTRAIARGAERAGVPRWSPNQLRKAKAVEILENFSMEHAQAVLGHSNKETTARFYAKQDRARSMEVARAMG